MDSEPVRYIVDYYSVIFSCHTGITFTPHSTYLERVTT